MTELTLERLKSLVSYDPETGDFHALVKRGPLPKGTKLGGFDRERYWTIRVDKGYRAHRLAWFYAPISGQIMLVEYPKWLYSQSMPSGVIVQSYEEAKLLPDDDWYGHPNMDSLPIVSKSLSEEGAPELVVVSAIVPNHEAAEELRAAFAPTADVYEPVDKPVDKRTKAYKNSLAE